MSALYYAHDVTSDLSGPGADFDYKLLLTAGTASPVALSVAKGATETSYLFTEPGDPGAAGISTGTFTFKLNVTTGSTSMSLVPTLRKINSSGGTVASQVSSTGSQTLSGGVYTWTWTNPGFGTWATGDRVRIDLPFVNAAAHATTTITIEWQTADSSLLTPWTFAGPIPYTFAVLV